MEYATKKENINKLYKLIVKSATMNGIKMWELIR